MCCPGWTPDDSSRSALNLSSVATLDPKRRARLASDSAAWAVNTGPIMTLVPLALDWMELMPCAAAEAPEFACEAWFSNGIKRKRPHRCCTHKKQMKRAVPAIRGSNLCHPRAASTRRAATSKAAPPATQALRCTLRNAGLATGRRPAAARCQFVQAAPRSKPCAGCLRCRDGERTGAQRAHHRCSSC
jgi:hypothetical protein